MVKRYVWEFKVSPATFKAIENICDIVVYTIKKQRGDYLSVTSSIVLFRNRPSGDFFWAGSFTAKITHVERCFAIASYFVTVQVGEDFVWIC